MAANIPANSVALTATVSSQLLAELKSVHEGLDEMYKSLNKINCKIDAVIAVLKSKDVSSLDLNIIEGFAASNDQETLQKNEQNIKESLKPDRSKYVSKRLKAAEMKSSTQIVETADKKTYGETETGEPINKKMKTENVDDVTNLNFSFKVDNVSISEADNKNITPLDRKDASFLEGLFGPSNAPFSGAGTFSSPSLPNVKGRSSVNRGRKRKAN